MSLEIFTALFIFALVSSITPGPNNLMLMASGANFGFKRTIPHMLGVGIGFVFMIIMVGIGLMQLFDAFPLSYDILKIVSVLYLIYLTYKIATASAPDGNLETAGNPFTFFQAASFQWVNPKAWTMALTAISIYSPARSLESVLMVALAFGIVNLPSVSVWIVMGQQLRRLLTSPIKLRAFNITMAVLLLSSLYPVLYNR